MPSKSSARELSASSSWVSCRGRDHWSRATYHRRQRIRPPPRTLNRVGDCRPARQRQAGKTRCGVGGRVACIDHLGGPVAHGRVNQVFPLAPDAHRCSLGRHQNRDGVFNTVGRDALGGLPGPIPPSEYEKAHDLRWCRRHRLSSAEKNDVPLPVGIGDKRDIQDRLLSLPQPHRGCPCRTGPGAVHQPVAA